MLVDPESNLANLIDTLLRISGAIQVLEELSANVSIGEFSEQAAQIPEKTYGPKN